MSGKESRNQDFAPEIQFKIYLFWVPIPSVSSCLTPGSRKDEKKAHNPNENGAEKVNATFAKTIYHY